MSLAATARRVERDIFGALVGTLCGVLASRIVLLVFDLHVYWLIGLMGLGAWSGVCIAHLAGSRSDRMIKSLQGWALLFRRICLRVMLWLIGAAAVFGVLSVLTGNFDLVGRLAGTAGITALAAGLLWLFAMLMDRETYRGMGLFGATSVIVSYLLVMPTIWSIGYRAEESAVASLIVALMMPAGLIVLWLVQTRIARIAGIVGILLYALVLIQFLIAVFWSDRWYTNDQWWESGFSLAGFGLLALPNLVGFATGDRRHWRLLGVAAAVVGWVICTWAIWTRSPIEDELIVVICSVAIAVAHANLTQYLPLRQGQTWLRIITILTVIATALTLDMDLMFGLSQGGGISVLGRISLASGILASCGTLALVILAALSRGIGQRDAAGQLACIAVTCPRCGKRQVIPLKIAVCARRGLGIHVHVQEVISKEPAPR